MKILFVCGCLEPGRDGVGDYTRLLGEELSRRGHAVTTVAIADHYVDGGSVTCIGENSVRVVRLSHAFSWRERCRELAKLIKEARPDVASLQYVPNAFHPKGAPLVIRKVVGVLQQVPRVQVFFHEAYLGDRGLGVRKMVLRGVQKLILWRLGRLLPKGVFHTSNAFYQGLLERVGMKASILPLFGNIPPIVEHMPKIEAVAALKRHCRWVGVYFGSLPVAAKLRDLAARMDEGIRMGCGFVLVGKTGAREADLLERLSPDCAGAVVVIGELPVPTISAVLQQCDFGVARNNLRLLGKSGTAASMREHGLPVWLALSEPGDAALPPCEGFYFRLERLLENPARSPIYSGVARTADAWEAIFMPGGRT